MENELLKILNEVQSTLKAPKNQYNEFGKYKYRSCEDILEAVKPLLKEKAVISISDELVLIGERFYVRATAQITDGKTTFQSVAYAREPLANKGMDDSQITGATSSYARKYALGGLLLIDDTKDADSYPPPEVKPNNTLTPPEQKKPQKEMPNKNANTSAASTSLTEKFKILRETLGDEDYFYILRKHGFSSLKEIRTATAAQKVLKSMESVAFPKAEFDGEIEDAGVPI